MTTESTGGATPGSIFLLLRSCELLARKVGLGEESDQERKEDIPGVLPGVGQRESLYRVRLHCKEQISNARQVRNHL